MSTSLEDLKGGESNCCGATMYEEQGICTDCGEHCESVEGEDEPEPTPVFDRQSNALFNLVRGVEEDGESVKPNPNV